MYELVPRERRETDREEHTQKNLKFINWKTHAAFALEQFVKIVRALLCVDMGCGHRFHFGGIEKNSMTKSGQRMEHDEYRVSVSPSVNCHDSFHQQPNVQHSAIALLLIFFYARLLVSRRFKDAHAGWDEA